MRPDGFIETIVAYASRQTHADVSRFPGGNAVDVSTRSLVEEYTLFRDYLQDGIETALSPAKAACRIHDDGVGFTLRGEPPVPGLGLPGIRERLNAVGGSLRAIAEPGCRTTILTDIPLGGC